MVIRIIVGTMEEKEELLQASRHIHDAEVDTDLPMVNTLCHLYLAPQLIEVNPDNERKPFSLYSEKIDDTVQVIPINFR
ncbi:hypothetical protein D3C85_14680 [compost metagenome]